jgi:hypothetical protein
MKNRVNGSLSLLVPSAFALAAALLVAACGSDGSDGVSGERPGGLKPGNLGNGTVPAGTGQPTGNGNNPPGNAPGSGAGTGTSTTTTGSDAGAPGNTAGTGGASGGQTAGSGGASAGGPSGSGGASGGQPSGSGGAAGGEPSGSGGTSGGASPTSIINTCHIVAFAMCNHEGECTGKGLAGIEQCEQKRRMELTCNNAIAINPEIDECLRQIRAKENCPFVVPAICKMAFTYKAP